MYLVASTSLWVHQEAKRGKPSFSLRTEASHTALLSAAAVKESEADRLSGCLRIADPKTSGGRGDVLLVAFKTTPQKGCPKKHLGVVTNVWLLGAWCRLVAPILGWSTTNNPLILRLGMPYSEGPFGGHGDVHAELVASRDPCLRQYR